MRALDVLAALPYVKPGGYGVIGHSLGGHNAMCTTLYEDRLKMVVASAGFDSYLDHPERMWQPGKGWSQEAFAQSIGLDRSYMGGVERGERNISLENIDLIARGLGVTLSELFSMPRDPVVSVESELL